MKYQNVLILFLCLVSLQSFGQSSDYTDCDSILNKRSLSVQDLERLDAALFSLNYYRSDTAQILYKRAIIRSEESGLPDFAAHFEIWLADLLYEVFQPDSGLYYANRAARRALEMGDSLLYARTANIRRLVYTARNDFETAFQICFEALDVFERNGDEVGRAITLRDIGSIRMQESKYSEALDYCLRAVNGLEAVNHWYELTFTYQRVAIAYRNLGDFKQAHQYIQKAIYACRQLKGFRINQGLAKKYWTQGYIYEAEEKFDQALLYYDSAQYFAQVVGYPIEKWVYNSKGEVYLKQKNYTEALTQFEASLKLATGGKSESKAYDFYFPVYSNLVEVYEAVGNYQKANEYLKAIANAKDTIFKIESEKQVAELETRYETAQKETLIKQLQLDKVVQKRFLILGSILMVSLVLLAILLWRNIHFRKAVNRTLQMQKEEIEVKNGQNEMLLREIHHRVKNNLQILSSLLNLQADYIKDENALSAITEGRNRVQSMAFIHQQLYSEENVTAVNFKEYLADLCSHLSDTFSTDQKTIEITLDVNVELFDVETAIPLGLIVNELVTNSIKYAFKDRDHGRIRVKLWQNDDNQLCLEVADDGKGLPPSEPGKKGSFGSDLIKILSQKLRGSIEIKSKNGYVTLITFNRFNLLE